jgi:triosephosphate isomerase
MKYIIANHKQNMSVLEFESWLKGFFNSVKFSTKIEAVVSPSLINLFFSSKIDANLKFCSQDLSQFEENGPYTGKVGVKQVSDLISYGIVGHTELANSTDLVIKKAKILLNNSVIPIICFSDSSELQNYIGLKDKVLFAWENPTNIADGKTLKKLNLEGIICEMSDLKTKFKLDVLLYGGSVGMDNYKPLLNSPFIDGLLIGTTSLDAQKFAEIVSYEQF